MNVSIEILEFPLCVKNKILRIKDITKLNIEYIAGKNIIFNNSNLGLKEPHKIIISNGKNINNTTEIKIDNKSDINLNGNSTTKKIKKKVKVVKKKVKKPEENFF